MESNECLPSCIHSYSLTGLEKKSYKCISKLELLLNELESLGKNNRSYIFRGQPNKDFILHPKAFRIDGIKKFWQEFPCFSYQAWCSSKQVKEAIYLCSNGGWSIDNWEVLRLLEITIYVMQYNYKLANYVKECPEKFDYQTQQHYGQKPPLCWVKEDTFQRIFYENLHQLLGLIALNGSILKSSSFNEILTTLDESLPQHYGVPTSALDWTWEPYISIYFALENIPKNSTDFSIYMYREINTSNSNPLLIKQGHPGIENPRMEAQKGIFTSIEYPCSFYFFHGFWPCIEDYIPISHGNFELVKYDIPICYSDELRKILAQKNITKKTLLLDSANNCCSPVPSTI